MLFESTRRICGYFRKIFPHKNLASSCLVYSILSRSINNTTPGCHFLIILLINFIRFKTVVLFIAHASLMQSVLSCSQVSSAKTGVQADSSGLAVLLVDTDRPVSTIDEDVSVLVVEV